jgi:hypothetical protein
MKQSLKIATIAALIIIAVGTFAFFLASAQVNSASANNDLATNPQISQFLQNHPQAAALGKFLSHATLADVTGTVVSESKGKLVLSTDSGQVRLLLPKTWSYNDQQLTRTELVNGDFAQTGQTVTFKVLEGQWPLTGFNINILIAYEAVNSANTHAYAILPFNIEATS